MSVAEKQCSSCKFWEPETPYERQIVADLGTCRRAHMFWDVSEWNENYDRVLLPQHASDMMFVQDGSDYKAELLTRAIFWCAHFEAKD